MALFPLIKLAKKLKALLLQGPEQKNLGFPLIKLAKKLKGGLVRGPVHPHSDVSIN